MSTESAGEMMGTCGNKTRARKERGALSLWPAVTSAGTGYC